MQILDIINTPDIKIKSLLKIIKDLDRVNNSYLLQIDKYKRNF